MNRIRGGLLVLLMVLCHAAVPAVPAESPCPMSGSPWACFGTLEIRSDSRAAGKTTIRFSFFVNDDLGVEIETLRGTSSLLNVHGSGVTLYRGLTAVQRSASDATNPFFMLDMISGAVLTGLSQSYPEGPSGVSTDSAAKSVTIGGRPVTMAARRVGDHQVDFTMGVGRPDVMEGTWRGPRLGALPDAHRLNDWSGSHDEHFATLGAARLSVNAR